MVGWDTPGHYILNAEFSKLALSGTAVGWGNFWFGGFPVFLFYPPGFYYLCFLISQVFQVSNIQSMNIGILITIFLLAFSIYSFSKEFIYGKFPKRFTFLFTLTSIFYYFSYGGDGLQATSLIGIVEGTFISSFGHALLLLSLSFMERFRKSNHLIFLIIFTFLGSLLLYSHLLTSVFFFLCIFLYFFVFFDSFKGRKYLIFFSILIQLAIASPVIYPVLKYSEFTSGASYSSAYPPLLSLLGKNVFENALQNIKPGEAVLFSYIKELFFSYRILYFLSVVFILYATKTLIQKKQSRFILLVTLIFLWLSLDHSIGFLSQNLKIHNYRAFDLFFLSLSILYPISIFCVFRNSKWKEYRNFTLYVVSFLHLIIFLFFNPFSHQGYKSALLKNNFTLTESMDYNIINEALSRIPNGSLVQPEVVRSKSLFYSPHWIHSLIYNNNLRNNLGLIVESSIYPTLLFNWQEFGAQNHFRWGTDSSDRTLMSKMIDISKQNSLYLSFLQRSNVQYICGSSEEFNNFVNFNRDSLIPIFEHSKYKLLKIKNHDYDLKLPIGITIIGDKEKSDSNIRSFLRISNLFQTKLSSAGLNYRFIYLPNEGLNESLGIEKQLSFHLIIRSLDSRKSDAFDNSQKVAIGKRLEIFVDHSDFSIIENTNIMLGFIRTINKGERQKSQMVNWNHSSMNFFSPILENCSKCFINDTGRVSAMIEHTDKIENYISNEFFMRFGAVFYFGLIFSFWGAFSLIFISKIPYRSFEYLRSKFSKLPFNS